MNTRNRKGAARALMLIILVIVGVYTVFFYINMAFSGIRVGVEEFQEDIFTLDNALGPAKRYCSTALRYSVYQAMYDLGTIGGSLGIPLYSSYGLWYNNGDTKPDEQALLDNLAVVALSNLGTYTKSDYVFLDDYAVKLPRYTGLEISVERMVKTAEEAGLTGPAAEGYNKLLELGGDSKWVDGETLEWLWNFGPFHSYRIYDGVIYGRVKEGYEDRVSPEDYYYKYDASEEKWLRGDEAKPPDTEPEEVIMVKAKADKNLWIMKTMQNLDKIELERDGDLEEGFGTAYLDLYQKALGILGEVKGKFGEIKKLLDRVKEGSLTREQEGSPPQITDEEVFLETLKKVNIRDAVSEGDGEAELGINAEGILNGLENRAGETVVEFKILKDEDEKSISLGESVCTEQESQRTDGERIFYKVTKTCTFTYGYDYTVKTSVTDNSGKEYPVFNSRKEEISFEPLTLVFAAREWYQVIEEPIEPPVEPPIEPPTPPSPILKACKTVYGSDCISCPEGSERPEDGCIKGEMCCTLERGEKPVCCNPDTSECGTLGILASIFGEKANVCDIFECEDPTPKKCTYSGKTICCMEDEFCTYQTVKVFVKIPTCTKDVEECGADETEWGKTKEGKLCCKNGMEEPRSYKGVHYCLTVECEAGEELCEGTGQAEGRMNKCCGPGTTCLHHPNGYPRCVQVPR